MNIVYYNITTVMGSCITGPITCVAPAVESNEYNLLWDDIVKDTSLPEFVIASPEEIAIMDDSDTSSYSE